MADEKNSVFLKNLTVVLSPENFQKYVLGTKKNGNPRAIYDIVKDYTVPKKKGKKKKKKKNKNNTIGGTYSFYLDTKKKKGKKKKKKHWHI